MGLGDKARSKPGNRVDPCSSARLLYILRPCNFTVYFQSKGEMIAKRVSGLVERLPSGDEVKSPGQGARDAILSSRYDERFDD